MAHAACHPATTVSCFIALLRPGRRRIVLTSTSGEQPWLCRLTCRCRSMRRRRRRSGSAPCWLPVCLSCMHASPSPAHLCTTAHLSAACYAAAGTVCCSRYRPRHGLRCSTAAPPRLLQTRQIWLMTRLWRWWRWCWSPTSCRRDSAKSRVVLAAAASVVCLPVATCFPATS